MTGYVVDLANVDASMLDEVGGKAANLGEIGRVPHVYVPRGVCLTTGAYRDAVAGCTQLEAALDELAGAGLDDGARISSIGSRIRQIIQRLPFPPGLFAELENRVRDSTSYAVRSSATAEDLPTASFAGQQDTYLNVQGLDALVEAVRRCWASLYSDRAIAYRQRNGVGQRQIALAVVVQELVDAQVAGTMFTAEPITSDRSTLSIDAGYGLGETMVSGLANIDNYQVRDGQIVTRAIAAQAVAVRAQPAGGTQEVTLEPALGRQPKLSDDQIRELATIGAAIAQHFGRPQDIEWALADNQFWIVQSRPITTLFPIPAATDHKNHVYMSFGHQQMMTDAMTPLGLSFFQLQLGKTPLVEAGGRFFIDLAPDMSTPVGRRLVSASMRAIDPLIASALATVYRRPQFMKNLNHDGPKYLSLNSGAGYFSWRLPVEAIKLYRSIDPTVIEELQAQHRASLMKLHDELAGKSGLELFDAIEHDLTQTLGVQVTDPRSMAVVYVGMFALSQLNRQIKSWLGIKGAGDVIAQSVTNDVTSQMGQAVRQLAQVCTAHPEALALLPTLRANTFFEQLAAAPGGAVVEQAFRDFLDLYGMRCPGEIDITRPRWSEDPTTLIPVILGAAASLAASPDPDFQAAGVKEALNMEQAVLSQLRPGRARQIRRLIQRVQQFAGYREYPKYLMMQHYWIIKQALLVEAERLTAAGIVAHPTDVYYLTMDEFKAASQGQAMAPDLVAARRSEFQAFSQLTPPRLITSDGEVPRGQYDTADLPAGALPGVPASAGTVEGPARVLAELGDAHLRPGEILVATYTDPSWTPLFLTAKGVVTEVGGRGTHGAVVAREYGVPAVVGVEGATRSIHNGQRIRVDGTTGYVLPL